MSPRLPATATAVGVAEQAGVAGAIMGVQAGAVVITRGAAGAVAIMAGTTAAVVTGVQAIAVIGGQAIGARVSMLRHASSSVRRWFTVADTMLTPAGA